MTFKELSELDEDVQQEYIEDGIERTKWAMEELKDIIDLPYPENFIKYTYGKRSVILQPTESFWDEFIEKVLSRLSPESAMRMRKTLEIIFKQRGSIEALSQEVDLIPYSAANLPHHYAAILRFNRNEQRHLSKYIQIIPDHMEEDF